MLTSLFSKFVNRVRQIALQISTSALTIIIKVVFSSRKSILVPALKRSGIDAFRNYEIVQALSLKMLELWRIQAVHVDTINVVKLSLLSIINTAGSSQSRQLLKKLVSRDPSLSFVMYYKPAAGVAKRLENEALARMTAFLLKRIEQLAPDGVDVLQAERLVPQFHKQLVTASSALHVDSLSDLLTVNPTSGKLEFTSYAIDLLTRSKADEHPK